MTYNEFCQFFEKNCLYETIYLDGESRTIVVIRMPDLYSAFTKMQKREREMQIFEVTNSVPAEHFIKMSNRVQMLQALNSELLEALQLADAALRGSNMNLNVVERKIKEAIERTKEFGHE